MKDYRSVNSNRAQADGWEKHYQYKFGKKKVYTVPSSAEAQELVRDSKYPKNTKYGRQNPIAENGTAMKKYLSSAKLGQIPPMNIESGPVQMSGSITTAMQSRVWTNSRRYAMGDVKKDIAEMWLPATMNTCKK